MSQTEREIARQRLTALNVDGWRLESAHGCDGSEEGCAATCPVAVQIQVSPDEIIDAITLDALASRDARLAAVEALADDFAASKERAARWAAETHTAFREAMSRKVAWEEAERSLRAALRSDPDEASTDA